MSAGGVFTKIVKSSQPVIKLTDEQQEAVKKMKDFLESDQEDEFVLIGPAGAGKTFVLRQLLKHVVPETTIGITVSHAAKVVLQESLGPVPCYTLAQALGMRPDNSSKEQRFIRDPRAKPYIEKASLVIVDECSMIDEYARDLIYKYSPSNAKIIYVGDDRQLPPVGERVSKSKVFNIPRKAELTISQRFKGAIGTLVKYYRDYVDYVDISKASRRTPDMGPLLQYRPVVYTPEATLVVTDNREYFIESAQQYFAEDINNTQILAFRNVVIDQFNELMREQFRNPEEMFEEGERIILNGPYTTYGNMKVQLHNGQTLEIDKVSKMYRPIAIQRPKDGTHDYKLESKVIEFRCYELITVEGYTIYSVHPDSLALYNATLADYVLQAKINPKMWRDYHKFKDQFINYSYLYCRSSHKAQGQSIDNVFVMADDIMGVKTPLLTRMQSLHVAASRARKTLYILLPTTPIQT